MSGSFRLIGSGCLTRNATAGALSTLASTWRYRTQPPHVVRSASLPNSAKSAQALFRGSPTWRASTSTTVEYAKTDLSVLGALVNEGFAETFARTANKLGKRTQFNDVD